MWPLRILVRLRLMVAKPEQVLLAQGSRGQNPLTVLFLLWAVLAGAAYALGTPPPNSVTASLPNWLVIPWYLILCVGGVIAIVGIWIPDLLMSLFVERSGMMMVSPAAAVYASASFAFVGWRAIGVGGITGAFAIACAVRWWQINLMLWRLKVDLAEAVKRAALAESGGAQDDTS